MLAEQDGLANDISITSLNVSNFNDNVTMQHLIKYHLNIPHTCVLRKIWSFMEESLATNGYLPPRYPLCHEHWPVSIQ